MPIEGEANKVFWVVPNLHSYNVEFSHWKILQKTIYFMGVPIEGEANKVFWVVPSLHSYIVEFSHWKIL